MSERRSRGWLWCVCVLFYVVFLVLPAHALEEGEIKGKIERAYDKFTRDYDTLDYKGDTTWQAWGKGLKSLGWIVVQGDSGQLKDYLLLVIDSKTELTRSDGTKATFGDLAVGKRISAAYSMGYDALHASKVRVEE
jgi:hypothetical protein